MLAQIRRVPRHVCVLATLGGCLLVGCGRGGTDAGRAEVAGKVTLDGQPIERGNLTMIPAEGTKGPAAGATISGGHYRIPAASGPAHGTYKVQITARRKTGRKVTVTDGPGAVEPMEIEETEQYIPAPYNTRTELAVEITPGKNRRDFKLSTEP